MNERLNQPEPAASGSDRPDRADAWFDAPVFEAREHVGEADEALMGDAAESNAHLTDLGVSVVADLRQGVGDAADGLEPIAVDEAIAHSVSCDPCDLRVETVIRWSTAIATSASEPASGREPEAVPVTPITAARSIRTGRRRFGGTLVPAAAASAVAAAIGIAALLTQPSANLAADKAERTVPAAAAPAETFAAAAAETTAAAADVTAPGVMSEAKVEAAQASEAAPGSSESSQAASAETFAADTAAPGGADAETAAGGPAVAGGNAVPAPAPITQPPAASTVPPPTEPAPRIISIAPPVTAPGTAVVAPKRTPAPQRSSQTTTLFLGGEVAAGAIAAAPNPNAVPTTTAVISGSTDLTDTPPVLSGSFGSTAAAVEALRHDPDRARPLEPGPCTAVLRTLIAQRDGDPSAARSITAVVNASTVIIAVAPRALPPTQLSSQVSSQPTTQPSMPSTVVAAVPPSTVRSLGDPTQWVVAVVSTACTPLP